jgi:LysR family transcriptional regulator, benzoate and cis,cis-muconate-responsive activator of ben and cat genes
MESRQLRYFVTVARERHFTRAAEKLHMAQPPLSRQIQQLEDEMGMALFDRASRPLALTDAGRLLFEQAVQLLEHLEETRAMMRRLQDAKRARLAIGFVGSTLYGYLPEVIRAYRAARPRVEINLVELTTIEQVLALKEGRIDIGFGRIVLDDPAVERIVLRHERLCAALPLRHRFAERRDGISLEELVGDPLIVYPRAPRPSYADQVLALFRERDLRPTLIHEVREVQTALGLVSAEAGISIVPASVARLRPENVAFRPLREHNAVSPIILSRRKGDRSPEGRLILKLIQDIYREKGVTPASMESDASSVTTRRRSAPRS